MKLTPEMIDAAVIQLRMIFEHGEDIPPKVRDTGKTFLDSLDEWSTGLKEADRVKAANPS